MSEIQEYLKSIVFQGDMAAKLRQLPKDIWQHSDLQSLQPLEIKSPVRSQNLEFSSKQLKFPKGRFDLAEKKAQALHSFANHELLAIELMAATLLKVEVKTEKDQRFFKAVVHTLGEEQTHCRLYIERLNELGFEFGDLPLNSFFWNFNEKISSFAEYFSIMSLTFESANLDFAAHYIDVFNDVEDWKTKEILEIVLRDEISHVQLGGSYLKSTLTKSQHQSLWEYYVSQLPFPLTPKRARGINFDSALREKAKLPADFIQSLVSYDDDFQITSRPSRVAH